MNICRVSIGFLPKLDGWSLHAYYLSLFQSRMGHNVLVLQPYMEERMLGTLTIKRVSRNRDGASPGRKRATLAFSLRAALRAYKLCRARPCDVLHVHGDVIEACVFGLLARVLGVPLVLTIHSTLSRRFRYRMFAFLAFRLVSAAIAVSEEVRGNLTRLGMSRRSVAMISSGVDSAAFGTSTTTADEARGRFGVPPGKVVISYVGRLHKVKGLHALIDAARELQSISSLEFVLAGDGEEGEALRARARDAGNIRFLGRVEHSAIPDLLRASDIFVLPSVDLIGHAEGTPTALLEAMASGLPAIVTDSGGLKFVVEHGKNGLVVRQGSAQQLAAAIRILASDADLRSAMGARNRRFAEERDWSSIAEQVVSIYKQVSRAS